jgi:phospholipase/lecithinase/hemolysin
MRQLSIVVAAVLAMTLSACDGRSGANARVCSDVQEIIDAAATRVDVAARQQMGALALGRARKADDKQLREAAITFWSTVFRPAGADREATTVVVEECDHLGHAINVPTT